MKEDGRTSDAPEERFLLSPAPICSVEIREITLCE